MKNLKQPHNPLAYKFMFLSFNTFNTLHPSYRRINI